MLEAIQQFFQRALAVPEASDSRRHRLTLELATAALLCEIVRADHHDDASELEALHGMLKARFALTDEAVDELIRWPVPRPSRPWITFSSCIWSTRTTATRTRSSWSS